MRPAIRSENPLEWLLLRAGMMPVPLLDGYWGMAVSRTIITAAELGVFDALAKQPMTAAELADALGCDLSGIEILLGALNGARYLTRRDGRYSNGRVVRRWLTDGALVHLRESLLFFGDLWEAMSELTNLVRTGAVDNLHYADRSPEFWNRYLRGLAAFAPLVAPEIARKAHLPAKPARLLDVGGGHGLFAAAFVRRHPGLSADVLDLPEACAIGREVIAEAGLADRVAFREADARTDPWGTGYDAVLLFNLVHNLTPEESQEAMRNAHAALRPGGVLVVLDSEYREGGGDVSLTAGLNEMMFYLTSGTRVYPERLIRRWMTDAGFTKTVTRHLIGMPMMVLMTAMR